MDTSAKPARRSHPPGTLRDTPQAPFCSVIQAGDLGYIFPARSNAPPCLQRVIPRRRAREPPTPVLPSVERATPRARGDNFDGSGYDARGAAGLRATITPRELRTWTRRRHVGHSITARLFAPCFAPRPTIAKQSHHIITGTRGRLPRRRFTATFGGDSRAGAPSCPASLAARMRPRPVLPCAER